MGDPDRLSLPPAFDDLETGITVHDPESGAILGVNDHLTELYGYSEDELLEMDVGEYSAPDSSYTTTEALERIRAAADGQQPIFEWRVERASGELVWVRVRLTTARVYGREVVLAEVRDITEYKARERRLRLLNRVIRHNLRNETNVLMGYADRLQTAIESDTLVEEVEMIMDIARDIGHLSESVRQIEEIADPSATNRAPTNVGELAATIVAEAREQYPEATIDLDAESSVWVNADDGLEYALGHAIENAVEHNDREGPTVTVSVGAGQSGRVYITVTDDGPSIPEMEIGALNADTTTTSTDHGAGLGLWVMDWCVESLGGDLSFEENEPRGNVVWFSLPATDPPAA